MTEPNIRLIARPQIDEDALSTYLAEVGGQEWIQQARYQGTIRKAQTLAEFAGRICYRSWKPGLNRNITRVRTDQDAYLENILRSAHGSVLEHMNYSFIVEGSRVLTHEWVRHRAGTAISQESMRYVRLEQIPFHLPDWAREDRELYEHAENLLARMEWFQKWMADHFKLDREGLSFHSKKEYTSFMRRFAPEGVGTALVWTANVRAIRHVIASRTARGAEEEIRIVAGKLGEIMKEECPALFSDFEVTDGEWVPKYQKV